MIVGHLVVTGGLTNQINGDSTKTKMAQQSAGNVAVSVTLRPVAHRVQYLTLWSALSVRS